MQTLQPPAIYIGSEGRKLNRNRAQLLAEIATLPQDALISTEHAAAFIDATEHVLAQWRYLRKGPPYVSGKRHVRYRIKDLKDFIEKRLRLREATP
jgi:hypothetical protein